MEVFSEKIGTAAIQKLGNGGIKSIGNKVLK